MADDTQKKVILNLYAAFAVSLLLSFVPSAIVAMIALIFFVGVLIAAYVLRGKADVEDLQHNHMTYIIRTIWLSGFLGIITTTAASFYMLSGIDYSPLDPCVDLIASKDPEAVAQASADDLIHLATPCMNAFLKTNQTLLYTSAALAGAPMILYIIYRFGYGLTRAMKGYRVANVKTWL